MFIGKVYSEEDITWSSIEKYYQYDKVIWSVSKEGIPRYKLIDENHSAINVEFNNE